MNGEQELNPSLGAGAPPNRGGRAQKGGSGAQGPQSPRSSRSVSGGRTLGLAGSQRLPPHPAPGAAPPAVPPAPSPPRAQLRGQGCSPRGPGRDDQRTGPGRSLVTPRLRAPPAPGQREPAIARRRPAPALYLADDGFAALMAGRAAGKAGPAGPVLGSQAAAGPVSSTRNFCFPLRGAGRKNNN